MRFQRIQAYFIEYVSPSKFGPNFLDLFDFQFFKMKKAKKISIVLHLQNFGQELITALCSVELEGTANKIIN